MFSKKQEKGYKKLLTWKDRVPAAEEYETTVAKGKNRDDIVRFNDLNEDAISSIDHTTKQEKLHLGWLKPAKRPNIWKGIAS